MKLEEFMKKEYIKMPEEEKLLVFDDITRNIQRKSIFYKISMYTKIVIHTSLLVFVASGIFFYDGIDKNGIVENNGTIGVNADYIGKIIESTGEFEILNKNNVIGKDIIKKLSVLTLGEKSTIALRVNEGINLYLVGPAKIKFDFYENDNGKTIYTLNMLDGDYMTIKSNSIKDKILLKSEILDIESNENLIDLKYEKKGNAMIIENNGGNITVKNDKNLVSLNKEEKLILGDKKIKEIENIFDDEYKKYQIDGSGNIKYILDSDKIKRLGNILEKNTTALSIGKYVLGNINKDEKRSNEGKKELKNMIQNIYSLLDLSVPSLLETKISIDEISVIDFENLIDGLLQQINQKYVLPKKYTKSLEVILAYLVITEKAKIKNEYKIEDLSSLLDIVNIKPKYKKIMLNF